MKSLIGNISFLCLFVFFTNSCGNRNDVGKTSLDSVGDLGVVDSSLVNKGVIQNLDVAILELKNSDDFIKTLSKKPDLFSELLLNNPKKVTEYESSRAKALNVGVYGADLNYIIHFNQIQISFKYLLSAKQLSDQIGVAMAFDKKALDKFNTNIEEKDTLINIVSSAYDLIKKYLKNGSQFQVASLVMAGSWIENMHITLNILSNVKDEDVRKSIIAQLPTQQGYALNLLALLTILNPDGDEVIVDIVNELGDISQELISIKLEGKTDLKKLETRINALRSKIISLK